MEFFNSLCDLAATFNASDPEFGLFGAVLSPAQYDIISPGRPFVERANPGQPRPLADGPRRRLREVQIKCFEVQQLDIRQLKKMIVLKIHFNFINLMSEPIIRMAHRSIQWIVQDFYLSGTVDEPLLCNPKRICRNSIVIRMDFVPILARNAAPPILIITMC